MTSCAVCGSELGDGVARPESTYAARGAYRIGRCARCGCGETLPQPDAAELAAFYAKEYAYDAHVLIANEKRWRAKHILDFAMQPGTHRILDIGCMYGYLLDEAVRRGAVAVGVELSAAAAKQARARRLDVFTGTVEAFAVTHPQPFDLVIAQHVLEHVGDLDSFLRTTRSLLGPNGRLCICVPNFDASARRIFPSSWAWYQVPVHLHHFGEHALRKLLARHDFVVEQTKRRGGDSLFFLVTLLQAMGRGPSSDSAKTPGRAGAALLRTASRILRPYYFVGDDELLVLSRAC